MTKYEKYIEPEELGKAIANTQYWYSSDLVKNLSKKVFPEKDKKIAESDLPLYSLVSNAFIVASRCLERAWKICEGNGKRPLQVLGMNPEELSDYINSRGLDYLSRTIKGEIGELALQVIADSKLALKLNMACSALEVPLDSLELIIQNDGKSLQNSHQRSQTL
jgi:hypothetical protein